MPSPFDEKRQGAIMLSLAFVMSPRAGDIFEHFRIVTAGPINEADPDTIVYYGFHPGFKPFDGDMGAVPLYHPYWDSEGELYFQLVTQEVPDGELNA